MQVLRKCIRCFKIQISLRKRATYYRALLRKMTYEDMVYASLFVLLSGGVFGDDIIHVCMAERIDFSLFVCVCVCGWMGGWVGGCAGVCVCAYSLICVCV